MSYNPDELAESLRRMAISCMPIEQRIQLGERSTEFREEERHIPYQINLVHIDMRGRIIECNVDKHKFLIQENQGRVQVTLSDGTGQSSVFPMPTGLSLRESLKKISDYFLGRPGTRINQFFISSEDVLETCNVPSMVHERYICYDSHNLEKSLTIKCPEAFVFVDNFRAAMLRSVYERCKSLHFTDGMALEIGSSNIETRFFTRARAALADLNPKLGLQPKHECYDAACKRPFIEFATHLQCLVFDIEGTQHELVVCLPDYVVIPNDRAGLNHIVRFKVVPKGTTSICEEAENWLSVFEYEGFVTFTNMAM
ncbi:hypothetical protein CAEBREN_21241 [Caenorhabditis brenneri]|uniref:Uncharacterized protein n=1 Tax=Caenorhabditis brenneri TaxID=135651 RepID=G0NA85_CAEBE|nr:hypothetical protein CAEBREN_21241 [Caenorhabditis brenneri]